MTELRPRDALVAGRRVRWRAAGAGQPVALVHGLAGSWRWWRAVVPALAERHEVHVLDLPRFGLPGNPRPRAAAGWLACWLEAAAPGGAALVGHSLGGLLAARVAAQRPELVARLALLAPAGVPAARHPLGWSLPLLRTTLHRSAPGFRRTLVADATRAGPATLLAGGLHAARFDVRGELAAVTAPTLILWGARDPLLPARLAEDWRAGLPHARVTVLDEAGHVPMADDPAAVAAALLAFLAA